MSRQVIRVSSDFIKHVIFTPFRVTFVHSYHIQLVSKHYVRMSVHQGGDQCVTAPRIPNEK